MQNEQLNSPGLQRRHAWGQLLASAGALLAVYILFAIVAPPTFRSLDNLENMARQSVSIGVVACGMTVVMIMGGIDLSAGSVAALCCVVVAWVLRDSVPKPTEGPWIAPASAAWKAVFAAMAVGTLVGLFNGLVIARLKIMPFITTLGTLLIARGLAKGLANEQSVYPPKCPVIDTLMSKLDDGEHWRILPTGVWIMLGIMAVTALMLNYTILGRQIFAVGSSERAARLCGIRIGYIKVFAYALMGWMSGVAGIIQFSKLHVGDSTTAEGLEFDAIAAVVVGGGSFSGGEGKIFGTLIGTCVMQVIKSGCAQMGWQNWKQQIAIGCIIIVAAYVDLRRQKKMNG